jgi:hypothetical protein
MDGPPLAGSTARALRAKGLETERTSAIPRRAEADDPGRGNPGKPVGAAAKVLRTLHASERPLNASEVARAAGLHCGTAYTATPSGRLAAPCNWRRDFPRGCDCCVSGDFVDYAIEGKTAWMDCQRFATELQLRRPWISTPS